MKLLENAVFNKIILVMWVGLCFLKMEIWSNSQFANLVQYILVNNSKGQLLHCILYNVLHFAHSIFHTLTLVLYSLYKSTHY